MSVEWFVGFADGASFHTCNLASATWVIYSPLGQLVAFGGACLGPATNNVADYNVVIELLWDVILYGITHLKVRLDSQLVLSQLKGDYQVWNPSMLYPFLRVRLLERNFEYISFNHISRKENTITDAYAIYILDWQLTQQQF